MKINNRYFFLLLLICIVLITSCDMIYFLQDTVPIIIKNRVPCVVIDNDEHYVSVVEEGQNLHFRIEVLSDVTDNRDKIWPEADIFKLAFDYNLNYWITASVDTIYFKEYGPIDNYCATTLIGNSGTSSCSSFDSALSLDW